jgi:hypothetical protein
MLTFEITVEIYETVLPCYHDSGECPYICICCA